MKNSNIYSGSRFKYHQLFSIFFDNLFKNNIILLIILFLINISSLSSQFSLCATYINPPSGYEVINWTNHSFNGATYYYKHKYINVSGSLTISSTASVLFEDCIFNMEHGSIINIESATGQQGPNFLYLLNSKLFCCDLMWDGIRVNSKSKLIMYSSQIEDAMTAIGANYGAELSLSASQFKSNNIGLLIPIVGKGRGTVNITQFSNIRFENTRPMNIAINGSNSPFCGISLKNVSNLDLSKVYAGDKNLISDHRNGIISKNSNFKLANWNIKNSKVNGNTIQRGYGIYCESNGNKIEIGSVNSNSNDFLDNEYSDFFSVGNCELIIKNNNISREIYSTALFDKVAPSNIRIEYNTSDVVINNNNIYNLNPNTVLNSIILLDIGGKKCETSDNTISALDNSNVIFQNYIGGIEYNSCFPSTANPYKIHHNNFIWNFHNGDDYGGIPIYVSDGSNIEVTNNTVTASNNAYGQMVVHGGDKININSVNNFSNSPESGTCDQCSAIELVSCNNCRICTNITSGNTQGIRLKGPNTMTSIGLNHIKNHEIAVLYSDAANVSQQIHTGNYFDGPFSGTPIMHCLGKTKGNEYLIAQNNYGTSLPFWPGTGSPSNFVLNNNNSLKGCLSLFSTINNNDDRFCSSMQFIFDSIYIQSMTQAELWSINQDFYNLYNEGYYENCDYHFDDFYNALDQSDIVNYAILDKKIQAVNNISIGLLSDKEAHQAILTQKILELEILNENVSDTIYNDTLNQEINQLQNTINSEYDILYNLDSLSIQERNTSLDQINYLITSLNPDQVFKEANKLILLATYKKLANIQLTAFETNSLYTLSNQCYLEYGEAALQASRFISNLPVTSFNIDNCNQNQFSNDNENNQLFTISDFSDWVKIESNQNNIKLKIVELFTSDGKKIYFNPNLCTSNYLLNKSQLFSGVYLLHIIDDLDNQSIYRIIIK